MKKILFFTAPGYAHVTRALKLAQEIKEKYKVVFFIPENLRFLAQELKVPYKILTFKKPNYKDLAEGKKIFKEKEIELKVKIYDKIIKKHKPDLVITSCSEPKIILQKYHIPHIALMDACLSKYSEIKPSLSLQFILKEKFPNKDINKFLPNKIADLSVFRVEHFVKKVLGPFNKVCKKFGTPEAKDLDDFANGQITLFPDLPSFLPTKNLPKNYSYIGPLVWDKKENINPKFKLRWDIPLVYLSMATSGSEKDFEELVENLYNSKYQVIISLGSMSPSKNLNKKYHRKGFYIVDFLPALEIFKKSKNIVVICHGGLGTVYQSILGKVKGIICLPYHPEHRLVAKRLEELNAGKKIFPNQINKIEKILGKLFKEGKNKSLLALSLEAEKLSDLRKKKMIQIIEKLINPR